jgi:hypothetical protein
MAIGNGCDHKGFRRKVYEKMYQSSMSSLQADRERAPKRIVPTSRLSGLREEFKKTFLPLLIDVFELRQKIRAHKARINSKLLTQVEEKNDCPQKILDRLIALQAEMEESQRWCQGIIQQISKGIEEAKEAFCESKP